MTIKVLRAAIKSLGFTVSSQRVTGDTWRVSVQGKIDGKYHVDVFQGDRLEGFQKALDFARSFSQKASQT